MIKTLIFDFGDVFINLDKPATEIAFSRLGFFSLTKELQHVHELYEMGRMTTSEFIVHHQNMFLETTELPIINAWNAILKEFPKHRLDFIKQLAARKEYQLILLSNTNELHINWIKKNIPFYLEFKNCFNAFYLSHEIHLRKPNKDIFQFVIDKHRLTPSETLFIDDTIANTKSAKQLGIHTWNNNPKTEDVTDLFTVKSNLF